MIHSFPLKSLVVVSLVSIFSSFSICAFADEATALKDFETAKAGYAQRSVSAVRNLDTVLVTLERALGEAESTELKYDILVLEARTYYFQGVHSDSTSAKKDLHGKGQAKADAAEALTSDYSEAPYFAGVNLARWGEANGIISSLTKVPALKKYMSLAMAADRTTRDDRDAEAVDGYGPHRTLGRMYKALPGLLGGSHTESVKELQKAVQGDPTTALNVVYLADTYMKDGNDSEKTEGRRLLNELLTKDPSTLNPNRIPETSDEFGLARLVLAGKEIQ
ncbi:hypothetical protein WDW37_13110 [Bdellovibrionota bacterium FG-1]